MVERTLRLTIYQCTVHNTFEEGANLVRPSLVRQAPHPYNVVRLGILDRIQSGWLAVGGATDTYEVDEGFDVASLFMICFLEHPVHLTRPSFVHFHIPAHNIQFKDSSSTVNRLVICEATYRRPRSFRSYFRASLASLKLLSSTKASPVGRPSPPWQK